MLPMTTTLNIVIGYHWQHSSNLSIVLTHFLYPYISIPTLEKNQSNWTYYTFLFVLFENQNYSKKNNFFEIWDVKMLHGLEMVIVMIALILQNATLMMVIAVEAMSIRSIAQNANVIGQAPHTFSQFLNLLFLFTKFSLFFFASR